MSMFSRRLFGFIACLACLWGGLWMILASQQGMFLGLAHILYGFGWCGIGLGVYVLADLWDPRGGEYQQRVINSAQPVADDDTDIVRKVSTVGGGPETPQTLKVIAVLVVIGILIAIASIMENSWRDSRAATQKAPAAVMPQNALSSVGRRNTFTSTPPHSETTPPRATTTERDWEIVEVNSKVTESNDQWWKYAWRLTIRNKGVAAHAFSGTIKFQDKDGFIVDEDRTGTLIVQPNAEDTFTGYALIRMPGANSVAQTIAEVGVQQ